jgi:hypothetical protein
VRGRARNRRRLAALRALQGRPLVLAPLGRDQADIRFARWVAAGSPAHSFVGVPGSACLACGAAPGAGCHHGRKLET